MHLLLRTLIFCFISLTLFNSCEEVIETNIDNVTNEMVMSSNFTADHELEVVVTSTKAFASNSNVIPVIVGAEVRVYQGNQFIEQLELFEPEPDSGLPPYYRSIDFIPQVGVLYTIKVNAVGFEPIEATNFIPVGAELDSVGYNNSIDVKGAVNAEITFDVDLNFRDVTGVQNYYHLLFYQELDEYRINNNNGIHDTIRTPSVENAVLSISLLNSNISFTRFVDDQSILLRDDTFDGESMTLNIAGSYTINLNKHLPGRFVVEMRTVSEDYYLYYTTLANQNQSNNDPLAEVVPIFDNIQNGSGIFAGYSTTTTIFESTNP